MRICACAFVCHLHIRTRIHEYAEHYFIKLNLENNKDEVCRRILLDVQCVWVSECLVCLSVCVNAGVRLKTHACMCCVGECLVSV